MTFSASASATAGNAAITFSGASGALAHTAAVTLTLTESAFTMSSDTASLALCRDCSGTVNIAAIDPNAAAGDAVDFAVTSSSNIAVSGPSPSSFGAAAAFAVTATDAAIPYTPVSLTVMATRRSDKAVVSTMVAGAIVIGGGTLHIVPRTTGDLALTNPVDQQYVTNLFATSAPLILKQCGRSCGI